MVMGRSLHHALDRDPIFRAVSSYYGVTTADGTPATLICNALLLSNDFITGKVILLDSGASAFETRGATVFAPGTGTITVNPAFSGPVLAGTGFYILTQESAAAALAVILAAIAALQADVGDASPASILGSLYGILGNPAVPLATSIAAILIAIGAGTGTSQGLFYYGLVTGAAAPSFTIAALAGLGNGKFADPVAPYWAFLMRRAAAPGVAPQGEQQAITAYVSVGGVFTALAFTAPGVAVGDEVLIIHPRLAEMANLGYEGATSLANKLTAARAALLDRLSIIAAGGANELTPARAALLSNLDAAITTRAAPGDAMALVAAAVTAIRQSVCVVGDPASSIGKLLFDYLDATVASRAIPGDAMALVAAAVTAIRQSVCVVGDPAGSIGKLLNDYLNASVLAVKTQTDKLPSFEHEVEWTSTPVAELVADVAATPLTAGAITPTFPAGSTRVRAILVASIHAANQSAATHHIGFEIEGLKTPPGGAYADLLVLTAVPPLALVNLDGTGDGWCGAIDVTALVDTSAVLYNFRFVVDSDNAGGVNYTTGFTLVLIYKI